MNPYPNILDLVYICIILSSLYCIFKYGGLAKEILEKIHTISLFKKKPQERIHVVWSTVVPQEIYYSYNCALLKILFHEQGTEGTGIIILEAWLRKTLCCSINRNVFATIVSTLESERLIERKMVIKDKLLHEIFDHYMSENYSLGECNQKPKEETAVSISEDEIQTSPPLLEVGYAITQKGRRHYHHLQQVAAFQ